MSGPHYLRENQVIVDVADLARIADYICNMDGDLLSNDEAGECHELIIKMMGPHASKHYAQDDEVPA